MTIFIGRPELEKLAKLCGLFSSHHDGERASAAAKADALVRSLGPTWRDIVLSKNAPEPASNSIEEKIRIILANLGALNAWECGFIHDVNERHVFSEKQRAVIERLWRKVRAYYARGAG